MKLKLIGEHQDDAYPEIGEVTGLYWNHDRSIFAVVSTRSSGVSSIRPRKYSDHCQRLSLYDAKSKRLINSTSGMHYKILDVCFHQTERFVVIGTGEYDGGYFLQGELVTWNWQTGERKLISGSQSFYRTRFISSTDIDIVFSPDNEEADNAGPDAFATFLMISFSLENLVEGRIPGELFFSPLVKVVEEWDEGFKPIGMYTDERKAFEIASQKEVAELIGVTGSRGAVVDILSVGAQLFTIKNRPAFERRALDGKLLEVIENSFSGAQIFCLEDGRLLINTDKYEPLHARHREVYGRLLIWNGSSGQMETFLEGGNPFLLSQSSEGLILARSCGRYSNSVSTAYRQPMGVDFLIDRGLTKKPLAPLGSTDRVWSISTRDSKGFYFMASETPWDGFPAKQPRLAIFTADDRGVIKSRIDYFDKRANAEAMELINASLGRELFTVYPVPNGDHLIGAAYFWEGTNQPMKRLIWRHDLSQKAWLWQKQFSEAVLLLLSVPSHKAVIAGFDGGILRLLDADTGDTLDEIIVTFAGIPSLPMEACIDGNEIILATLESRILRFRIE